MRKILLLVVSLAFLAALAYEFQLDVEAPETNSNVQKVCANDNLTPESATYCGIPLEGLELFTSSIAPNQPLSEILNDFYLPRHLLGQLGSIDREVFDVRRIRAGNPYALIVDPADSLSRPRYFVYHPDPVEYVVLEFGDELNVWRNRFEVDTIEQSISGVITSSLYQSIMESGAEPELVNELADVYAWEIDFFGLQKGDSYRVVYRTLAVNGEYAGFDRIVTAAFRHQGQEKLAFAFDQGDGLEFFDAEGESLRKTFLKAPLRFSRISSRFSYNRLHPIFKVRRPHLGVDYAAPRGTPVVSVGDGVVVKKGYHGGAGHMIKVKHNGQYTTAYLHLSRYAKGIRRGTYVKQGEVIGYVGSTGHSTGPHLDFRFYKGGRAVDPLKVDPPSANPITPDCMSEFLAIRDLQMAKLAQVAYPQPLLAQRKEASEVGG